MVEKPMATSVAGCDEMIAASREGDAFLMVAHCWRFRDEVRAMRARIAAGELGEIVKTHGYGVHAGWGPSGWFTDPELAGGGALVDMGVHAIDTARFLLGDPAPGRVCATIGTRYAEGRYTVDDDGVVMIAWDNGTNSVVESGWWHPHMGGLEADTEVYGTKGYARIWPRGGSVGRLRALHAADVQRAGGGVPGRDRRRTPAAPVRRGRPRGDAGRRGRVPFRRSHPVSCDDARLIGRSTR